MAVASLVLGIISIVFWFIPMLGWLGAILGIIGIVLGSKARKEVENKGMATGGFVCSIIGTVLNLILFVACSVLVGAASSLPF